MGIFAQICTNDMAKNSTFGNNPVVFPSFSLDVQNSRIYAMLRLSGVSAFVQPLET